MFEFLFSAIIFLFFFGFIFSLIANSARGASKKDAKLTDQVMHGFIYVIQQQHCGVVERLGKFHHIVNPGLHICIPVIDRVRDVSLMTEDNHMKFDAKTKDNVTIELAVSIQYHVDATPANNVYESGIYRSLYTLTDPVSQMCDYFADALRSQIPRRTLDEVFEEKDTIAEAIEEDVSAKMADYGYHIVTTLITSIILPQDVQASMNRIIATKNDLESAKNEAEAHKQKTVIAAQAEADAMELAGKGIAAQRIAIAEGLASSVDTIKNSGLTPQEANGLLMFTQNIDMMSEFAKSGRASTVVLPSAMFDGQDTFAQMFTAMKTAEPKEDVVLPAPTPSTRVSEQHKTVTSPRLMTHSQAQQPKHLS